MNPFYCFFPYKSFNFNCFIFALAFKNSFRISHNQCKVTLSKKRILNQKSITFTLPSPQIKLSIPYSIFPLSSYQYNKIRPKREAIGRTVFLMHWVVVFYGGGGEGELRARKVCRCQLYSTFLKSP